MRGKFIDLTGQRFGRWVIIKFMGIKNHQSCWLCRCDCGKEREVKGTTLVKGRSKSCGCFRSERVSEATFIDLTGQRFGRLIVLHRAPNQGRKTCWSVKCDCGNEKIVQGNAIKSGTIASCGCYHSESARRLKKIEYGLSAKRSIFRSYKQKAKERKLIFDLTFEQFLNLTQHSCHYCGTEPNNLASGNGNGSFTYNGIDRIDNTKGYIIENCVPCCEICNKAKRDLTQIEFINWGERLGSYLKNNFIKEGLKQDNAALNERSSQQKPIGENYAKNGIESITLS